MEKIKRSLSDPTGRKMYRENGQFLGTVCYNTGNYLGVRLPSGTVRVAEFGYMDSNGNFLQFCQEKCSTSCPSRGKASGGLACRQIASKHHEDVGYFAPCEAPI